MFIQTAIHLINKIISNGVKIQFDFLKYSLAICIKCTNIYLSFTNSLNTSIAIKTFK